MTNPGLRGRNVSMRWIPSPDTKAGMVLGECVVDSAGRTLAKRGESVSGELIALFQNAGVKEILAVDSEAGVVFSMAPKPSASGRLTRLPRSFARAQLRFHRYRERPVMQRSSAWRKTVDQDRISRLSIPPQKSRKNPEPPPMNSDYQMPAPLSKTRPICRGSRRWSPGWSK